MFQDLSICLQTVHPLLVRYSASHFSASCNFPVNVNPWCCSCFRLPTVHQNCSFCAHIVLPMLQLYTDVHVSQVGPGMHMPQYINTLHLLTIRVWT